MEYIITIAATLIATASALSLMEISKNKKRHRHREGAKTPKKKKKSFEFSKLMLSAVLLTYFVGFGVAIKVVFIDVSQLGVFLAYIGTPTATAIGFYAWKAKAENIIKIKKNNPDETTAAPVDLNNIIP